MHILSNPVKIATNLLQRFICMHPTYYRIQQNNIAHAQTHIHTHTHAYAHIYK